MTWDFDDIPDQTGRTFLVTGATSGIGEHTALELARRNARVILAARSPVKLAATAASIEEQLGKASVEQVVVDLTDLSSVRRAATQVAELGPVDVLVNNAGVMATPDHRSVDGLDLQLATNHFGPFLLTGLLLPQLTASGDGRVATVSSGMHHRARQAPLDDPRHPVGRYARWQVYAQSKLANLLFTYELDRRARVHGLPVKALAAHPGYAATNLIANGQTGRGAGGLASIYNGLALLTAQSRRMGALPTLVAATADLPGSTYLGPSGFQEMRGLPKVVRSSRLSRDEDVARRLWQLSEETVGLRWL